MELRNIMYTAQEGLNHPIAIRYPRGRGVTLDWQKPFSKIEIGTAKELKKGSKVAILSLGHIASEVQKSIDGHKSPNEIGHYDMRFVKPLDKGLLDTIFKNYEHIITVEDGCKLGGFGSSIIEYANEKKYNGHVKVFAIEDSFISQGTMEELYDICGLNSQAILKYLGQV